MRTDEQVIFDKVYSAMETGNHAEARRILKEYEETFSGEVRSVRRAVLTDYGVQL